MVVHYGSSYVCALASMIHKLVLIHFSPMFHFYIPVEKSENQRFFYPFQGYGNRTSVISDSTRSPLYYFLNGGDIVLKFLYTDFPTLS